MNQKTQSVSLSEVHESVDTSAKRGLKRKLLAFLGPAYMVSVGYMDPGNWATDIAGGSRYGYALIWVLLMSNLIALLLQSLSARLGIVRGRDLAQASREMFSKPVNFILYLLAEIAIAACDLAEVLGMAIGLKLLFGLNLTAGILICALDTFLLLFLLHYGIRKMEAFIIGLVAIIGLAFLTQMIMAQPVASEIITGFIPSIPDSAALYIAIGIIGATVMPHNLYLHSALVQTRKFNRDSKSIRKAIRFNIIDSTIALNMAFFVNAAILILAASTFFKAGMHDVADIMDAHRLLEPMLGTQMAPALFAIALICAGQSSTITGTLAGQIVMEGYLNLRIAPWIRRIITRIIAIVPAVLIIHINGEEATGSLLIFSQVILSLQLGFAIIPLIHFVSDKAKMGEFTIPMYIRLLAWLCACVIVGLNVKLVVDEISGWMTADPHNPWIQFLVLPLALLCGFLLLYIAIMPFFKKSKTHEVHIPHGEYKQQMSHEIREYKRIAITIDFSSADRNVLDHAISQGRNNAVYTLLHVTETASAIMLGTETSDYESSVDAENLEKYKSELEKSGYKCEILIGYGRPSNVLPEMIKQVNADLVVMGAHGHKGIMDFIFGSTIDKVRHKISVPVLVVSPTSQS